jgi:hypothetical protein
LVMPVIGLARVARTATVTALSVRLRETNRRSAHLSRISHRSFGG